MKPNLLGTVEGGFLQEDRFDLITTPTSKTNLLNYDSSSSRKKKKIRRNEDLVAALENSSETVSSGMIKSSTESFETYQSLLEMISSQEDRVDQLEGKGKDVTFHSDILAKLT